MDACKKYAPNVDKNILDLFWRIVDKNSDVRLKACADILRTLWRKQQAEDENVICKDLKYCIGRLVKGLASSRDAARLGYTVLLTEILKKLDVVQIEEILELMKKHLTTSSQQDKCDIVFGQLFAYTAVVRSGRLVQSEHLSHVILSLYDLCLGKIYILNACHEVFQNIFSQLSIEDFKGIVWPQLKKKIQTDWEHCSTEPLWMLLLCMYLFPECINAKYLRNHWGADDIFAPENLEAIKKIMKRTTSSLPMLHPLCSMFWEVVKDRKDFSELWRIVVDENLFDLEQTEKACVGFAMIKLALQNSPTKKIIKTILSTKFRVVFSKSFLTSKHPLNPAADHLADFLCNYAKESTISDVQVLILKVFIQPPGNVIFDQSFKKKQVSLVIRNLLPDAVKAFCEILKAIFLKKKLHDNTSEKEISNVKRLQAAHQISNLVSHPATLTDLEWRLDTIEFLFLHSFFTVKEPSSELSHCDNVYDPLPDILRNSCMNEFFRSLNSLHISTEKQHSSLSDFLQQLMIITDFAEQLMNATENVEGRFPAEKIAGSWKHFKSIIHKLSKQSRKDGQVNESNAFQALFLQLGLLLFQDPEHISDVLEELYICCKKALKVRKKGENSEEAEDSSEKEPPWIGVVIDILLSLLSKSSKPLRDLVAFVFPLFCSFIDHDALQQILDVINPHKADEDMLVEESDNDKDADFGSGSSSEESEAEPENSMVDEHFKKKVQDALGAAAEDSDAESVVLSDSEMFKLDDALSEAFKGRMKSGHTQQTSEDKTLLHFRVRCFDLIMAYMKSEPPLHLVLLCIEPVLAAYELGHQNKHQSPLLEKAVSVLQVISKMKKFQDHSNVNKSELKRLLDVLIPKCHKEVNITLARKLYSVCVFIVLCYRKLDTSDSPDKKKSSKTPSYIKTYLSNLDTFVSKGSTNMLIQFFTQLMEACPDLAWHFVEPCKNYAFGDNIRLFKRTQCLGLLLEALKYSKGQKEITPDQWLEFGNSILPLAVESLKDAMNNTDIKQLYISELLNVIYTTHIIIESKTGQFSLESYAEILPLLQDKEKMRKLNNKARPIRNKILAYFERSAKGLLPSDITNNDTSLSSSNVKKRKEIDQETDKSMVNGCEIIESTKKSKHKKRKSSENSNIINNKEISFNENI